MLVVWLKRISGLTLHQQSCNLIYFILIRTRAVGPFCRHLQPVKGLQLTTWWTPVGLLHSLLAPPSVAMLSWPRPFECPDDPRTSSRSCGSVFRDVEGQFVQKEITSRCYFTPVRLNRIVVIKDRWLCRGTIWTIWERALQRDVWPWKHKWIKILLWIIATNPKPLKVWTVNFRHVDVLHGILPLWLIKAADEIWRFVIFHTVNPDHGTGCSQQEWISSFSIAYVTLLL